MPQGRGSPGVRYCAVCCELRREARADCEGLAPRARVRARAEGASQNSECCGAPPQGILGGRQG